MALVRGFIWGKPREHNDTSPQSSFDFALPFLETEENKLNKVCRNSAQKKKIASKSSRHISMQDNFLIDWIMSLIEFKSPLKLCSPFLEAASQESLPLRAANCTCI